MDSPFQKSPSLAEIRGACEPFASLAGLRVMGYGDSIKQLQKGLPALYQRRPYHELTAFLLGLLRRECKNWSLHEPSEKAILARFYHELKWLIDFSTEAKAEQLGRRTFKVPITGGFATCGWPERDPSQLEKEFLNSRVPYFVELANPDELALSLVLFLNLNEGDYITHRIRLAKDVTDLRGLQKYLQDQSVAANNRLEWEAQAFIKMVTKELVVPMVDVFRLAARVRE